MAEEQIDITDRSSLQLLELAKEQVEVINKLNEKSSDLWSDEERQQYDDAASLLNDFKEELKNRATAAGCNAKETTAKSSVFEDTPECEQFLATNAYAQAYAIFKQPVDLPDPCGKSELSKINTSLLKFFKKLKSIKKYGKKYLKNATNQLENVQSLIRSTSQIIGAALKSLMQKTRNWLIGKIRDAIEELIDMIFPTLAKIWKNTIIGEIINNVLCKFKNIIENLGQLVGDFLFELIGKVANIPFCAAEQFANGLINNVAAMVDEALGPVLKQINNLLKGVGKIAGSVFEAIDFILGFESYLCQKPNCPELKAAEMDPFGSGALKPIGDAFGNFKVPSDTGLATSITSYIDDLTIFGERLGDAPTDIPSSITQCDVDAYRCGPPKIEIFGGGGLGAAGSAVVNNLGQIYGINLNNGGSGYSRPPFVSIVDSCDNGRYASAYSEINSDGEVTRIVMVNPGNGYLNEPNGLTEFDDTEGIPSILPIPDEVKNGDVNDYIVCLEEFQIISTGIGYEPTDEITIVPDIPNLEANVEMTEVGQIIGIQIIEKPCGLTDIPEVVINSPTGVGVQIKPVFSFHKIEDVGFKEKPPNTVVSVDIGTCDATIAELAQKNIVRVIDCPRGV